MKNKNDKQLAIAFWAVAVLLFMNFIERVWPSVFHLTSEVWTLRYWGGAKLTLFTLLQSIGFGMLALFGGFATWRRVIAADDQARANDKTAKYAELGHWSDRFTNAGELLAADTGAERCAGVAILGDIGREVPETYRDNCIRMLQAFIHLHRRGDDFDKEAVFPTDTQMALDTLGSLQADARLPDVDLTACNFNGAILQGRWINFTFRTCSFNEANLSDATFDDCSFFGAEVRARIRRTHFNNCNFNYTTFRRIGMSMTMGGCTFTRCEFWNADLRYALLVNNRFDRCGWGDTDISSALFRTAWPFDKELAADLRDADWAAEKPPKYRDSTSGGHQDLSVLMEYL